MKSLSAFISEGFSNIPEITGFHLSITGKANIKKAQNILDKIEEKFRTDWNADVDEFEGKTIMSVTGNLFYTYQAVSDDLCDKLFSLAPVTRIRFKNLTSEQQSAITNLCASKDVTPTFETQSKAVTVKFEPGLSRKSKMTPVDLYLLLQ